MSDHFTLNVRSTLAEICVNCTPAWWYIWHKLQVWVMNASMRCCSVSYTVSFMDCL